mmetsp:Transcript_22708/g.63850  ORF Transcript_22708/g.63850 Transcript_22708/m.63850 type:complete len:218 (+) Transcript_22708:23-676(+)
MSVSRGLEGGSNGGVEAQGSGRLVAEVSLAGDDHGDSEAISGVDDVLVSDRSPRLDDCGHTGLGGGLQTVGEGEEGVRGEHATRGLLARLADRQVHRIDPVGLSRADTHRSEVPHEHDGVRLDVLGRQPGEAEVRLLLWRGLLLRDHLEVSRGRSVRRLEEQAARDRPDDGPGGGKRRAAGHQDAAVLLLGGQPREGSGRVGRRDKGLHEQLAHALE